MRFFFAGLFFLHDFLGLTSCCNVHVFLGIPAGCGLFFCPLNPKSFEELAAADALTKIGGLITTTRRQPMGDPDPMLVGYLMGGLGPKWARGGPGPTSGPGQYPGNSGCIDRFPIRWNQNDFDRVSAKTWLPGV